MTQPSSNSVWLLRRRPIIEAMMLVAAAALLFYGAVVNGDAYDERAHLNTGLAYWARGIPALDPLNTPLRVILGLPAWWLNIPVPTHIADPLPAGKALAALLGGRAIMIALFLAWCWSFGRIAARWLGPSAGLIALALILFEPTATGHANLVGTDVLMMMTAFWLLAVFYEWVIRPSWGLAALLGLALGLCLLAKLSALVWCAGLGLGWLVYSFPAPFKNYHDATENDHDDGTNIRSLSNQDRGRGRTNVFQLFLALFIGWVILCIPYRFAGVGASIGQLPLTFGGLFPRLWWLGWAPNPLPRDYVMAIDGLLDLARYRHTYFHGELRTHGGFALYFPGLLAMKPPLALHGLLAMAFVACLRLRRWRDRRLWLLVIPPLFFLLYSSFCQTIMIGVRLILPVFPLIVLAAAWGATASARSTWRGVGLALVAGIIWTGASIAPHQLAYFNPLAGGPAGAWRWYNDSNQDWGQGAPFLECYIAAHPDRRIQTEAVRGRTTGWVALSPNQLTGLSPEKIEQYRWLREQYKPCEFVLPYWHVYWIEPGR